MTNADAIRAMNDEEIYDFLFKVQDGDIDYAITFCSLCAKEGNELGYDCGDCLKHWLKQDAREHFQGLKCPCGQNSDLM